MKKGLIATSNDAFEAVVYWSATFSARKYKQPPLSPASINKISLEKLVGIMLFVRNFTHKRLKNKCAIKKRINRISAGAKSGNKSFVELKVTPQTKIVKIASKCPFAGLESIMFIPLFL